MTVFWFAVIPCVLIVVIDAGWRWLAQRGKLVPPFPRYATTGQVALVAAALIVIAAILDGLGLVEPIVTSDAARGVVLSLVVVLQLATVWALTVIARRGSRPS